jgi:hypothetical protein
MDHNTDPFQLSIAEFSLESGTIGYLLPKRLMKMNMQ